MKNQLLTKEGKLKLKLHKMWLKFKKSKFNS